MFRTPRYQKIKNQEIVKWVHFKVEKFRIFIQPEFVHPPQMGHIITLLYDSASPAPLPSCFSQSTSFGKAQLWCHLLQEMFLKLVICPKVNSFAQGHRAMNHGNKVSNRWLSLSPVLKNACRMKKWTHRFAQGSKSSSLPSLCLRGLICKLERSRSNLFFPKRRG